jgi:hypothetical protein
MALTKTRQGSVRVTWLDEDVLCDDLEPLSPETRGLAMPRGFRFPQLLRRELVISKLWVSCTRDVQEVKARLFLPGCRMSPTWHRACVKHMASQKSGLKSSIRRGVVSRVAGPRVEDIGADRIKWICRWSIRCLKVWSGRQDGQERIARARIGRGEKVAVVDEHIWSTWLKIFLCKVGHG